MDVQELYALIQAKESDILEFKTTTGQLERGMESLCGFINGNGGAVIFGINDDGTVKGQEITDKTKREIAEAIRHFEPFAKINTDYVDLHNGKSVVVISGAQCPSERPFLYKGRAYQRLESTTSIMPQTQYNQLLLQREHPKTRWELMENPDIYLDDLDEEEIRRTLRVGVENGRLPEVTLGYSLEEALERMHLLVNGKSTNAAVVLFAKEERADFPQCLLRLARFKGTDKKIFVDNKQVRGNVFRMLDEAMSFFFKHLSLSGEIKGLLREEHLSIPYLALREAVVNALCHRDYQTIGGSVGIAIFDDRIEISNYGRFPMDMDFEKNGRALQSIPQNPLIAMSFYYRKLFENWGRGIDLMLSECKKANVPEPHFYSHDNLVAVVFPFHRKMSEQVSEQVSEQISEQVQTLVNALQTESSLSELMGKLNLNSRQYFMNKYLNPAIQAGFVELTQPNSPKSPTQKYRLTTKGKGLQKMFL